MTADIEIREAVPDDVPALEAAIEAIYAETEFLGIPGTRPKDWAAKTVDQLTKNRDYIIYQLALDRGAIVGYLLAYRGLFPSLYGAVFIEQIGLRASHRGRGIGARLMAAVEPWARARNAHRLSLMVDLENARALALYRRFGLESEGSVRRALRLEGSWRTQDLMAKQIRRLAEPSWPALEMTVPRHPGGLDGIAIRERRIEDAALLVRWERQFLGEFPFPLKPRSAVSTEEQFRDHTKHAAANSDLMLLLVAVEGAGSTERILAVLDGGLAVWPRMRHEATINMNVLREAWGRGIGRALHERVETWARGKGARRLTCYATEQNRRGVRFAERQGFVLETRSPQAAIVEGRTLDRLRLGKLLD